MGGVANFPKTQCACARWITSARRTFEETTADDEEDVAPKRATSTQRAEWMLPTRRRRDRPVINCERRHAEQRKRERTEDKIGKGKFASLMSLDLEPDPYMS